MSAQTTVQKLLSYADIIIGGDRPWDIQVHDDRFYKRVLTQGSLGLGESYMDEWWDCDAIDVLVYKSIKAKLDKQINVTPILLWNYIKARFLNFQKLRPSYVAERHYDIGNDLYKAMLGHNLVYTSAYWKGFKTLGEAQEAKLDLVCKKIGLKKGDKVLDIGSGWGSFINFAAENYGAECVGITVSREQADYANANKGNLPVETRLQDYRDVNEKFDHIVSLGMFEHVGYKNYKEYMKKIHSLLKKEGLFLLHTIGSNKSTVSGDPWSMKYIFPDGMLPSIKQIGKSIENLFVMEDWHNFGAYYDTTLISWWDNFNSHWEELEGKYDEKFYRMWRYYLLSFAGSFRARKNQLWQIVLSKNGVEGGYTSIR